MSKINQEFLKRTIHDMISTKKPRKFEESIELQINLRDYDPEKEKRFSGAIKLPHVPHPHLKLCVIGTAFHCEQAKNAGIAYIDVEGLKKFNKERVPIKKWAKPFDILIASESLMRQIPKLLGNILNKINKFPIVVGDNEEVGAKIREVKGTVRFQLKKVLCLATAIGTDKLNEDQIRQNLNTSVNFLISLLKKGWQNIASLYIKTSMSKSYRIFG
eukprot:TRINITY_DN620_c0_g1_i2.p1 TRINITY_DN620_c0_g1~~TRINITY_DN620_c0_g1_i2.p1  ORF type:complete len:216 (+),score=42.49 TRINITY_DN620_c0_g1_i2:327-974(+)